ncbi:phosphatase PAP2 family protein [Melissospora conviva]|uniref:phosphatase PAP2 family protein n=1 Tax=Melissospora conviva TaxID=3388432 RepID=UPI003B7E4BA4
MSENPGDDVPEISGEWYRDIVDWANSTPEWVQWSMGHFTELSIVLLALFFVVAAWPYLGRGAPGWARIGAAGIGVVIAYAASEGLKVIVDQERPCRVFADAVIVASECPPTGDWSFPSNHSTIAGALAAAVFLLSRRLGWIALLIGMLSAFSRVFVGVHYPHDVVFGFLYGVVIASLVALLLTKPFTALLRKTTHRAKEPVNR